MDKIVISEDVEHLFNILRKEINPLVTYEEACKITGKSMKSLYSKISRSNIKPISCKKMLRYSDVIKIRDREI